MASLCSNRPESFGPHSKIHPNLPTTCFLDVVVVPLPTWLYLLTVPAFIVLYLRTRKARAVKNDGSGGKSRLAQALEVIYYILIVAMIAMESLEIARLSVAHLGIGLLPFVYVGVLSACAVHVLMASTFARGISALFWIALATTMAIKLAALDEEEGKYNRVGVASNYPLGDEVTDNGVMVGVEIVLAVLELVTGFTRN